MTPKCETKLRVHHIPKSLFPAALFCIAMLASASFVK